MPRRVITFTKKRLGEWWRDDGESRKLVNEESMYREQGQLIDDGWMLSTDTSNDRQIRLYEWTKV